MTPDERKWLNDWKGDKLSAIRKLEKTVRQTKALFDAHEFKTEPESEVDAYGFYIKSGPKYQLWVGIWTESPIPLSYGFHRTEPNWLSLTKPPVGSVLSRSGSHCLWPLEEQTWDKPEQVYERVKAFLDIYEAP
jgi:hypothetical protein